MKLILTSCDFRSEAAAAVIRQHLPPLSACRVLYFANEKATPEKIRAGIYKKRLAEFGFAPENVTVFDYFAPQALDGAQFDCVYISGGNTFGTLRRIRESGGDALIHDAVSRGAVYIGGSAGAHIACADVSHVAAWDSDTFGLTDFAGLALYDGALICHYTDAREAELLRLRAEGKHVTALGDDGALVIEK